MKESKWCNRRRGGEKKNKKEKDRGKASITIMGKVLLLDWERVPGEVHVLLSPTPAAHLEKNIPKEFTVYASTPVKPKLPCKVGHRMQAVMCNQKAQKRVHLFGDV